MARYKLAALVRLVIPQAWRHHCGTLNDGAYRPGAVCEGCRVEVNQASDVSRFLLVEAD